CESVTARARCTTARFPNRRRWSADSSCSIARAGNRPLRSRASVPLPSGLRSKCANSAPASNENQAARPDCAMTVSSVHRTIEGGWRVESAKIIGGLARVLRDVGLAEELAQDALVAALEQWPDSGIPDNPGAWLMATAKHRAIDTIRRKALHERKE